MNGMDMIPKARPHFGQEELAFVEKAMASGWVSNGPMVREFESQLAHYLGLEKSQVIAVTNCTSALHVALLSLGIGSGDEVLVSDFTFPATGHAVMYCGATPRFVDVDKDTYNMDWNLMEGMINERTKAIINMTGQERHKELSRRGIEYIRDNAEMGAVMTKWEQFYENMISHASLISLDPISR